MSLPRRLVLRRSAALAAVVAAFVAGAVTSAASHPVSAAAPPGVLDDAARQIQHAALHPVDPQALRQAAIRGMLSTLDDPWSAYYDPSDFDRVQDALAGSYSGVGLWLRASGRAVEVASVLPHSAAAAAGVRVGDLLMRVAGRPVHANAVAATVAALRGPAGSAVSVVVRRAGEDEALTLDRLRVASQAVQVEQVAPAIERIRIASFTKGTGAAVRTALATLPEQGSGGVLLDLRDNPGGLLTEAVETASAFLDGGPVVSYVSQGKPPRELTALGRGDVNTPLVVLVNAGTASAAEVVAGALQDRGRAVLVGARTFGKGTVQQPIQLSDGSAVELTVARYLTPNGRSVDGVGLEPDVTVPPGDAPGTALARGIDVLHGLAADVPATAPTGKG